jgi:hypothetical protein
MKWNLMRLSDGLNVSSKEYGHCDLFQERSFDYFRLSSGWFYGGSRIFVSEKAKASHTVQTEKEITMDQSEKRSPLHPEDLEFAKCALIKLREDSKEFVKLASCPKYGLICLAFWNRDKWSWHNDVPSERMYVCNFSSDTIDRLDRFIEWLESEIERISEMNAEGRKGHEDFCQAVQEVRRDSARLVDADVPPPQASSSTKSRWFFSRLFR